MSQDFGVIRNKAETETVELEEMSEADSDQTEVKHEEPRRSERHTKPPARFGFDEFADTVTVSKQHQVNHVAYHVCQITEPNTMNEALSSECANEWKAAADSEYKSLIDNETWDLVELPLQQKPIGFKWVFKVKHASDGTVERFKARLVAKGYAQEYGIDYAETFAPVVRFSSVRALLSFAVQSDMIIHQMDVVTAFLNGSLDEDIYMKQPDGYVKPGEERLVCKLKKALYGLKQSPRCWYKAFEEHMITLGFVQTAADPCVFIRSGSNFAIVAVYVDDLILITNTLENMEDLKINMRKRFKMKDMGTLHCCLGITVKHDANQKCLWLHQKQYILNMIEKYGLTEANVVSTPSDMNVKLAKDDNVSKCLDPVTISQ